MIKSITKILLILFFTSFLFLPFLVGLRISGYSLRGYYTNLICAISFLLSLLFVSIYFVDRLAWNKPLFVHVVNILERQLDRRFRSYQRNLFVCLAFINLLASICTILAFLIYQLSGFASSNCMQEFNSPAGQSIVIKSCDLTCFYSFHHNYFLVTEVEPFAVISPKMIGKCLGDRFSNLKLKWNQTETEIDWQITDYNTTSGKEKNPKTPITGRILVR